MGKTSDYFKGMRPDGDEEGGPYGPDIFDGAILQLARVRCGPSDDDFENEVIEVARCDREYDADLLISKLNEHNRLPEILFNQSARYEAELESLRAQLARVEERINDVEAMGELIRKVIQRYGGLALNNGETLTAATAIQYYLRGKELRDGPD